MKFKIEFTVEPDYVLVEGFKDSFLREVKKLMKLGYIPCGGAIPTGAYTPKYCQSLYKPGIQKLMEEP